MKARVTRLASPRASTWTRCSSTAAVAALGRLCYPSTLTLVGLFPVLMGSTSDREPLRHLLSSVGLGRWGMMRDRTRRAGCWTVVRLPRLGVRGKVCCLPVAQLPAAADLLAMGQVLAGQAMGQVAVDMAAVGQVVAEAEMGHAVAEAAATRVVA